MDAKSYICSTSWRWHFVQPVGTRDDTRHWGLAYAQKMPKEPHRYLTNMTATRLEHVVIWLWASAVAALLASLFLLPRNPQERSPSRVNAITPAKVRQSCAICIQQVTNGTKIIVHGDGAVEAMFSHALPALAFSCCHYFLSQKLWHFLFWYSDSFGIKGTDKHRSLHPLWRLSNCA